MNKLRFSILVFLTIFVSCARQNGTLVEKWWVPEHTTIEMMPVLNGTTTTLIPYTQWHPNRFWILLRSVSQNDTNYYEYQVFEADWQKLNPGDTVIWGT